MSIGMTYDQFWYGSPQMREAYRKVYEIKQAERNQEMWMQGLYNYRAFSSVIQQFSYGMGGGKGKRPDGYLEYPVPITDIERKAEKQRKIQKTLEFFLKGQMQ